MGSADELVPDVMHRIFDVSFNSLLDCACGYGKWGYLSRVRLSISGKRAYLVGCDLWLPNIRFCKKHQVYDDVIRCDVRALPLRDRSFEVVIACEVVEHLSKCDSQEFIVRTQRIPTKRFLITTPNGSWHQDESSGNEYQRHRSAWSSRELQSLGFDVAGVGGLAVARRKQLFRYVGKGRGLPALGSLILLLATVLSPKIPRLGTLLVASKVTSE